MARHFRIKNLASLFLIFAFTTLQSCEDHKESVNSKTLPAPGRERLPQIYIFWNPENANLQIPWAPPNPELFKGEAVSSTGFEARVVVENSADPSLMETRVRDWNSRPHDLIIVGPGAEMYKRLNEMKLPTSQASGHRFFLSDSETVKKLAANGQWQTVSILEKPVSEFLTTLCTTQFISLQRGCRFSEHSRKRPQLAKLPAGGLSVQFADFQEDALTSSGPLVSLSIAWDQLFRNALRSGTTLKQDVSTLKFADGTLRLKVSKGVPEEVSQVIKVLSLPLLMKDSSKEN